MENTNKTRLALILSAFGIFLCTAPVICAILSYFPVWAKRGGEAVVSGFAVLLITVAFVPICRAVKKFFASVAAYTLWLIAFIVFFLLSKIADEMTVISFVGFVGNSLGALCFKAAKKYRGEEEKE